MTEVYARPGTKPTKRELEVALAVLHSDSRGEAALKLGISEASVKQRLANLRVRLEARHTEELFFKLAEHVAA